MESSAVDQLSKLYELEEQARALFRRESLRHARDRESILKTMLALYSSRTLLERVTRALARDPFAPK